MVVFRVVLSTARTTRCISPTAPTTPSVASARAGFSASIPLPRRDRPRGASRFGPDQNIWFTENTGPNFDTRSPGKLGKLDIHVLRTKRNETHDFDGNGYSDIAWRDTSGNAAMWLMNGTTVASTGRLGAVTTGWLIVGHRELNGD